MYVRAVEGTLETGEDAESLEAAGGRPGPRLSGIGEQVRAWRALLDRPLTPYYLIVGITTLLLALGLVMVLSTASVTDLSFGLSPYSDFEKQLAGVCIGLPLMWVAARSSPRLFRAAAYPLLAVAIIGLCLILIHGVGQTQNGATRWIALGPFQFQPSELAKLALVLYAARYLAENPKRANGSRGAGQLIAPLAVVAGPACMLILLEPDMGTMLVVAFTIASLLIAAGTPKRHLLMFAGLALILVLLLVVAEPYQRARLTSFLHPWSSRSTAGFQAVQGQIALGSGGLFGVGLGQSVQKVFYLPEAQTDFILAVIGEELGVMGIGLVVVLYGMIAYAGLRTARRAAGRYAKLLAAGLTSLILCQGILNIFVVLGLAPLTGVPLPFISYAPTNLCVMLAAVGLLLNISQPGARRLRAVEGARGERAQDRDRRRRDRRPRRPGPGGR
jgi:cell division protein FtsW